MGPIRVLEFTNATVRAGAEDHILLLLKGMNRALFQPYFVCTPELAKVIRADVPGDVDMIPLDLKEPTQVPRMAQLARILHDRKIQILHSHMFYSSLCASPVGWLRGVPVVIETSHGREAWRTGWKARFFVDRLVGRFVDEYIAVSHANRRYLVEEKKLPKGKIAVISNGCDLTRFCQERSVPSELKRELGFGEADSVLVTIARLEPQKGHSVLLNALPAVLREFPCVRLVCVGDGALREKLEKQTRELKLDASVRFVGYQSNVADWLALAEFTVLPSFYEGLPLAAIESLAASRAVVATAVDGTTEVVFDRKTGLTVPPGNALLLSKAIIRMLTDPSLRQTFAAAGRELVMEHFSQTRQVRETEQFYLRALGRNSRGHGPSATADGPPQGSECDGSRRGMFK
jgi:glycosyltransferase involved in cell wall biosynthesis